MVGKPRGRNFLVKAALLMITWSSNAWRTVLDPESITMSFTPASVNLVVSSASFLQTGGFYGYRAGILLSQISHTVQVILGSSIDQRFSVSTGLHASRQDIRISCSSG